MAFLPVFNGNVIQANTIDLIGTGAAWFSEDTGAANTYQLTFSGASPNYNTISSLSNGQILTFVAANSNSGASTLQINALTPVPITKNGGDPLDGGEVASGALITVVYNGDHTRFELMASGGGTTDASDITSGILAVNYGGTGADLAATGGPGSVLQQTSPGGPFTSAPLPGYAVPGMYGDGSDGVVTIDATWVGANSPLTRNWYFSNPTFSSGITIQMNGFMIYCNGLATMEGPTAPIFAMNGGNASGHTGGTGALTSLLFCFYYYLAQGVNGANGGAINTAGPSCFFGEVTNAYGGAGGAGSTKAGGVPSFGGYQLDWVTNCRYPNSLMLGALNNPGILFNAAGGGCGGGGAPTTYTGGGGGGGGGMAALVLAQITGSFTMSAIGGNGGAGGGANAGGGGGGGGGYCWLMTSTPSPSVTQLVTGGAGGASGGGTATAGASGSNGTAIVLLV
jgi:hypothetical protein